MRPAPQGSPAPGSCLTRARQSASGAIASRSIRWRGTFPERAIVRRRATWTTAGAFLDPDALREQFGELGIDEAAQVGAYCGSGVSAAHQVLALELAGYPAALYAGSWSEWITDPERPVAHGP